MVQGDKEEKEPGYMKTGWKRSRWQKVARYRLGNKIRGRENTEKMRRGKSAGCIRGEQKHRNMYWKECG